MAKILSVLIAVSVGLAAGAAQAKSPKQARAKHKTHVVRVAREAAPAERGVGVFAKGPLYFNDGTYLGDDPDPNIRFQLWRDVSGRFGGDR
jgi:hypothetical protein